MKLFLLISAAYSQPVEVRSRICQIKRLSRLYQIDCEKFIEKYEARGPRPDYDLVGDQPPEAADEQFRICTEQLAALQQQQEQENELDRSLDLKWVTRNWEQIEVGHRKLARKNVLCLTLFIYTARFYSSITGTKTHHNCRQAKANFCFLIYTYFSKSFFLG